MSQAKGMAELDDAVGAAAESGYQSLCPWATLALILAILSPTALVTPLLLAIPAAAVGAALLALARIRRSDGALTGARMARWAMTIAIACVIAPIVRDQVRNALMRRQTTAVAEAWLAQVAQGQVAESRALLSLNAIGALAPRSEQPGAPPPDPKVVETVVIEKLRSDPLTRGLAEFKTPLTVTLQSPDFAPVFDGQRTLANGVYRVESAAEREPLLVQINFLRQQYYENEGRPWRIDSWKLVDETAAPAAAQ
jgi:hypothetical protein